MVQTSYSALFLFGLLLSAECTFWGYVSPSLFNSDLPLNQMNAGCRSSFVGFSFVWAYPLTTCTYQCFEGKFPLNLAAVLDNGTQCGLNRSCNAGLCQSDGDIQLCNSNFPGEQPITMGYSCQVTCQLNNGTTFGFQRENGTACEYDRFPGEVCLNGFCVTQENFYPFAKK